MTFPQQDFFPDRISPKSLLLLSAVWSRPLWSWRHPYGYVVYVYNDTSKRCDICIKTDKTMYTFGFLSLFMYIFTVFHCKGGLSSISPPTFPSAPPPSTPFLVFSVLTCLCPCVLLHLAPAHLTIHLNSIIHFLFSLISSLCSA